MYDSTKVLEQLMLLPSGNTCTNKYRTTEGATPAENKPVVPPILNKGPMRIIKTYRSDAPMP